MMFLMALIAVLAVAAFCLMTVAAPGNDGARWWERAMQGSEYPAQPAIPILPATPEGVVYAPAGSLVTTVAGNLYVKGTDVSLNTGWKVATLT